MVSKYGSIKTEFNGIVFDSKAEADRYLELLCREQVGDIRDLELQPRYDFKLNNKLMFFYKGDFRYYDNCTGKTVIEDVKGVETAVFRLKKKIIEAEYGIKIEIVK